MKYIFLFIVAFSLNSIVFAKKMVDFNKAMQEEINGFVKNNPEKYETKDPKSMGRSPASVKPVAEPIGAQSEKEKKKNEDTFEKMDGFDNQGIGLPKW